jgi:hypothetical protein
MLTPTVTEIPRHLEPITADDFGIRSSSLAAASLRMTRRRRHFVAPARSRRPSRQRASRPLATVE